MIGTERYRNEILGQQRSFLDALFNFEGPIEKLEMRRQKTDLGPSSVL